MLKDLSRFLKEEDGATAIEYGLIAVLISIAIAAALGDLGDSLTQKFIRIGTGIRGA